MSSNNFDRPGFPGDGDHSIELHHDAPAQWTKKTTTWAVSSIVIAVILSIVAIVLASHKS